MFLLGCIKHEALSVQPRQQLLRQLLAVVVILFIPVLQTAPNV